MWCEDGKDVGLCRAARPGPCRAGRAQILRPRSGQPRAPCHAMACHAQTVGVGQHGSRCSVGAEPFQLPVNLCGRVFRFTRFRRRDDAHPDTAVSIEREQRSRHLAARQPGALAQRLHAHGRGERGLPQQEPEQALIWLTRIGPRRHPLNDAPGPDVHIACGRGHERKTLSPARSAGRQHVRGGRGSARCCSHESRCRNGRKRWLRPG